MLRQGVVHAFLQAIAHFEERDSFRYTWFRFIPKHISSSFFSPIENEIKAELSEIPIFSAVDGEYRLSSEVITVPSNFRDEMGEPLIPEAYIPLYYLSEDYNLSHDGKILKDLGVREMSNEQFICGLRDMGHRRKLECQSEQWHETVCNALERIIKLQPRNVREDIKNLPILPLNNGNWISSRSPDAENVFFDLKVVGIPGDLGFSFIKAGIKKQSARYRVLQVLGVKPADVAIIAKNLLSRHERQLYGKETVESLVCQAKFMFAYRNRPGFPSPVELRVMDEAGRIVKASELYMDPQTSRIKMRDVLAAPARFLHSGYYEAQDEEWKVSWLTWLQDRLGVNVSPRIISGQLSPEFKKMAGTLGQRDPAKFLLILSESWSKIVHHPNVISQLAITLVKCEGGNSLMMNKTFIERRTLKHFSFDLPFLPIQDPDNLKWDFLKQLGVSTDANGVFFVKHLISLQQAGCKDADIVMDVYKHLELRFPDDPDFIR